MTRTNLKLSERKKIEIIRKVTTSGSSFAINIPAEWVDINKLKRGKKVLLTLTKSKIVIEKLKRK